MRIYEYLNGIRGALGSGEDTGVPTPAWRIEEYLKDSYDAIKAGGGGGGSSALNVTQTVSGSTATLDKTWQEIYDAFTNGTAVNLVTGTDSTYVYRAVEVEDNGLGDYGVTFWTQGDDWGLGYFCDAANKNPARDLS